MPTAQNWCRAGAVVAALALAVPAAAQDGNWVGTWTASAQPVWGPDFAVDAGIPGNFWDQTVRQKARVSVGGSAARFELSNEYGELPVTVDAARMGLAGEGSSVVEGSDREVTFGGASSITIPPGAVVLSDPVDLEIPDLADVSVSLYFAGIAPISTIHWDGHDTAYVTATDMTEAPGFPDDAASYTQRFFLTEILVDAPEDTTAVVLFGDLITDGDGSTIDGNDRWPNVWPSGWSRPAWGRSRCRTRASPAPRS